MYLLSIRFNAFLLNKSMHLFLNTYLLQNAKHDEAWMILKQVHDTNWRAKGEPERVFTVRAVYSLFSRADLMFGVM